MLKIVSLITLLLALSATIQSPTFAASHEKNEKAAESSADTASDEGGEKKKAEDEEEPECE